MKVKDAIKELQKLDPNATLIVTSSNFELKYSKIKVSSIHQYDEGLVKKEGFRDAFDGENYSTEVWNIIGGKEKVVLIS